MHRKLTLTLFVSLFTITLLFGQDTKPQPADNIFNAALKESKTTDKNVFLIFHASWCSWCKRLEKAMQSDELKKIFEDNYVITHLDVLEAKDKVEALENPGGKEIMSKLGGEKSGLPFYAFLDATGKKLADSNVKPKNMNIGYPGSPEEIDAFGKILKATAKHLDDEQFTTVIEYLKKNAPAPTPLPAALPKKQG